MAADKRLWVYPGIINNTCGSETWVILYWSLLHLSSCKFKNGARTSLLSNNKDGSPSLGGFGNYILTGANWESSVRTVFRWKMHVVRHQNFTGKKLFYFPFSPLRDGWREGSLVVCSQGSSFSGTVKLRSNSRVGMHSNHLLTCPAQQHLWQPATGKGEKQKDTGLCCSALWFL